MLRTENDSAPLIYLIVNIRRERRKKTEDNIFKKRIRYQKKKKIAVKNRLTPTWSVSLISESLTNKESLHYKGDGQRINKTWSAELLFVTYGQYLWTCNSPPSVICPSQWYHIWNTCVPLMDQGHILLVTQREATLKRNTTNLRLGGEVIVM